MVLLLIPSSKKFIFLNFHFQKFIKYNLKIKFYRQLELFVTWPSIYENVVVDSEGFTDLEPQLAPEWAVRVSMVPSPACLLGEYLSDFLQLCSNKKTMVELLGENAAYIENDEQITSVLSILTESKIPTISSVMSRASGKKSKNVDGPIPEEIMLPIMYFLFPDADEDLVSCTYYIHSFVYYH